VSFNPDQARDANGRWTSEGASAASDDAIAKTDAIGPSGSKEEHIAAAKAHLLAAQGHAELATNKSLTKEERVLHGQKADAHEAAMQAHQKEIAKSMKVKASREEWANRPGRESLGKRLGKVAIQIRERDGNKCVYCGKHEVSVPPARPVDRHQLDHLIPRVLGGEDTPTNLVTACKSCNAARHDMSVAGWSAYAKSKYGVSFKPAKIYAQAQKPLPPVGKKAA
jgi:hypothetical protein